jgi:hypothetical protein
MLSHVRDGTATGRPLSRILPPVLRAAGGVPNPRSPIRSQLAQSGGRGRGPYANMPAAYRFATVNDLALLGDARAWRERAARLLEASDLPVLLGDHGRIVFCGSYAYDTMMSPDIGS